MNTLALVDEDNDISAGGASRFGNYLADRAARFHEYGEPTRPLPAREFAAAVWQVATLDMSPGYVRLRPDLRSAAPVFGEESGALLFSVEVAVRHRRLNLATPLPSGVQDWDRHTYRYDGWMNPVSPADETRPAVLVTADIHIPMGDWVLYVPTSVKGANLVRDAKACVQLLADQLNKHAALVAALTE